MRRIPRRFTLLALGLVVFNSVGLLWVRHELLTQVDDETSPVRIVGTLPESNIDETERLSIVFNRDVGEPARLNDVLAESAPFEISPDIPGRWEWTSGRRLEFVLDDPLPAGRTFKVTPASGLDSQLGRVVQVDAELEFKTRPLKLTECRLVSTDPNDVTFELRFNQKVSPHELMTHLHIDYGDEGVADSFQARSDPQSVVTEPDESIIVRCRRPASNQLKLTLKKSLTGTDGDRSLEKAISRTLDIVPFFAFLDTGIYEGENATWQIDVRFSAGLDPEQKLPSIVTTPAVEDYSVELGHSWRVNGQTLRLRGRFESGRRYEVALPAGLMSEQGKPLGEDKVATFRIPDRRPDVTIPEYRGILSQHGNLELELTTVNVTGLRVGASRVHANNLLAHLQGDGSRQTSRDLSTKTLRIEATQNQTVHQLLNLRELLDDPVGVYRISAAATDRAWTRDSGLITVTDLGLTLKQSDDECVVWVTSLRRASPISEVRVAAVSYNNQTLAEEQTDEHGLVRLPINPDHPDGRPWVVIAEHGDQIAWLKTDDGHVVLDDVDQSGRRHPDAYDVLLYSERGTYRPGETIHLTGIIRDEQGIVPPAFPLSVHVVRPDGRTAKTLTVSSGQSISGVESARDSSAELLKSSGVFHLTYQPSESAWTGEWTFRVTLPGSDVLLGSTQAFVEEFVPVRLEVDVSPETKLVTAEAEPAINIESRYLFGQAAAGLAAHIRTEFRASRFRSAEHPTFTFGPRNLTGERQTEELEVRLDANGKARVVVVREPRRDLSRRRATSSVTVTEDGGRSVSTRTEFVLDRSTRHIGLRISDGGPNDTPIEFIPIESEVTLEWLLRDALDQDLAFTPFHVELQRIEHDQVVQRVNGRVVWNSVERTESIWKRTIDKAPVDEIGRLPFKCSKAGEYRLIATDDAENRSVLQFSAVSEGGRGLASRMNRPERLEIQLDKAIYRPGEKAEVVITSPFPGTALVCLESDRVFWSQVVQFEEASANVAIDVPLTLRGGAFVSATLLRPIDSEEEQWLPHRARGIARLKIDHSDNRLDVLIAAQPEVDPKDDIRIGVTTAPDAFVHVWAVDEGILATSGFRTPDPYAHFFAMRKNDVVSSDVFSKLLPDHRRPAGMHRIGGDDGVEALRRNPVPAKKSKAVVLWNGFLKADASGRVETVARLTRQFTGRIRWMAVSIKGDSYGSAEHAMNVTQPLLVEASWPRYVSTGDEFSVPVKLINTTDRIVAVQPEFETSMLETTDDVLDQFSIRIPPNGTQLVRQRFKAGDTSGAAGAKLTLNAVFLDPESGEQTASYEPASWCPLGYEVELSVRPVSAIETETQVVALEAGSEKKIVIDPKFLPRDNRTKLSFSSLPEADLRPAIESLMEYPYGCVEQTSSRLRSLVAAGHVLTQERAEAVQPLVAAGISRLWSLQLRSGGLSYWPGQRTPHIWGTAYAAETLLQARENGHEVDDRLLNGISSFLEKKLNDSQDKELGTKAAICECLSRLGSPQIGWMAILSEQRDELDMTARAQLAIAWWHAGRREEALATLPAETIDLASADSYGVRPNSAVTGRARLLAAVVEIDSSHEWIPILISRIRNARRNGVWLSTLDNALVLESLSAWRKAEGEHDPFAGAIALTDQQITAESNEERKIENIELKLNRGSSSEVILKQPLESFVVNARGSGRLSLVVQTTALTRQPVEEVDRRIRVRRKWLNRDGREIDPQSIRVGDLVIVEVRLRSFGGRPVENVAIVDALPGGLEIENPRLRTSDQTLESAAPDHVQFLDDRVVMFATARPNQSIFRYALRAMSVGSFSTPPIQASCMYNESISSVSGSGGRIRIGRNGVGGSEERLATKPDADAEEKRE